MLPLADSEALLVYSNPEGAVVEARALVLGLLQLDILGWLLATP